MGRENNYCIIMAGGVGSRFWPVSRNDKPKQFLDFFGTGISFLQQTYNRFAKIIPAENILVVTSAQYEELVKEQLPQMLPENILLEPHRRNTAPCIAYATYKLQKKNPNATVVANHVFVDKAVIDSLDFSGVDYIVDAIDNVTAKIALVLKAKEQGVPIISSMGTGNKLHPEMLKIADISKTSVCPLARVMRYELRRLGVNHLKVLFSEEKPITPQGDARLPASISFVPSVAGLLIAGEVIKDIAKI
jgi:hypothetical protein